MSILPKEELLFVEKLFREGRLEEALQLARDLENVTNLELDDKLVAKTLQLKILILQLELEKALKLADIVIDLSKDLKLPLYTIDGLLLKQETLFSLRQTEGSQEIFNQAEKLLASFGENKSNNVLRREIHYKIVLGDWYLSHSNFEKSLENLDQALMLNAQVQDTYNDAIILNLIAIVYFYYGHLDVALRNFEESLKISEKCGFKRIAAQIYHMFAGIKFKEDRLKEALEYELKSQSIWEELKDEIQLINLNKHLAFIYSSLGQFDKAMALYQSCLDYYEKQNRKERVTHVLLNMAILHKNQGNYEEALSILEHYYQMNVELNLDECIGIAHNWIGRIRAERGELELALEHLQKSLEIAKRLNVPDTTGELYSCLGDLYLSKGEYEAALEYHTLSLESREKMQISDKLSKIASSVKSVFILNMYTEEYEEAEDLLERLKTLADDTDNVRIEHFSQISQAIYLKHTGGKEEQVQALEIFETLANGGGVNHDIVIESILHLCEMLLINLSNSEEPEILQKVKSYIDRLTSIANDQYLYPLLSESYLLQAQLALLELKIKEAQECLSKSQQIAEEKDLFRLAVKISNEHDLLLDKLDQWSDFTMKLPSIAEKLELTHIEEMLDKMIKKRMVASEFVTKEDEQPILFMIINSEGTLLFTEDFVEQFGEESQEEFLTILRELLLQEEETEFTQRNRFHEYTYLYKKIDSFIFCYIYIGKTYSSMGKFTTFLRELADPSPIWDILSGLEKSGLSINVLDRMTISKSVSSIFGKK